jgi:hypothetical protein
MMLMDRIAGAKREFAERSFFWKHVLAVGLEERQRGLAVQWATSCAEQLIAMRFPNRLPNVANDIERAKLFFSERPDCDLIEVACEIWYRKGRDGPQTAISKLFTAIYEFHEGASCVHSAAAVISNLFTDKWPDGSEWHSESNRLFQLVMDQYDDLAGRTDSK